MGGMTLRSRAGEPAGPMALFAASLVIAAALIVGRQADAGEAGAAVWRIGVIQGEAQSRKGAGPWQPLRSGDLIGTGSEIRTGDAGEVRLTGPGGSVTALPNSRLFLRALRGAAGAPGRGQRIVQQGGNLQLAIAAAPDVPFRIETPFLTVSVKQATLTIAVNAGNAALYVSGGSARVISVLTGEATVVRPDHMAWVNAPSGGRLKTITVRRSAAQPKAGPRRSPARTPRLRGGRALADLAAFPPAG